MKSAFKTLINKIYRPRPETRTVTRSESPRGERRVIETAAETGCVTLHYDPERKLPWWRAEYDAHGNRVA